MSFREITFDNSGNLVFASDDSTLYDFLLDQPDGVIKGIHDELVTIQNGLDLEVSDGYAIILGRVLAVDKDTIEAVSIPVATGDEEGYLIIKIDLNQAEGSQASITYKKAASLPSLVQEDLLNDGMIYEYPLYTFTQTVVGITSITDVRTFLIPQNEVINAIPNNSVLPLVYVSNGKYSIDLGNNTFDDQNKLTVKFPSVIVDLDSNVNIDVTDLNGTSNYIVIVKDESGNTVLNQDIQNQIADIYRDNLNIIINRVEPIEAVESEYNLSIQSQQIIVPVEGSPFGDKKIDGDSAINIVKDGDGSSLINWEGLSCTLSLIDNKIIATGDGTSTSCRVRQFINVNGDIFSKGKVRVTNSLCTNLIILYVTSGGDITVEDIISPIQDQWYNINSKDIVSDATQIRILHIYSNITDANGAVMEIDFVMGITLLSSKQQALTVTQLALKYPVYFEKLKSIENPEIKVRNANLFDKNNDIVIDRFIDGSGIFAGVNDTKSSVIRVEPNTIYYLLKTGGDRNAWAFFDKYPELGDQSLLFGNSSVLTGTSPSDAKYLVWYLANVGTDFPINMVVGLNSTLVFKENDNSSKKYSEQTLRNLPNGVADYIDTVKNILHKLVSDEYTLEASDITGENTTGTYVDVYYFLKSTLIPDYKYTTVANSGSLMMNDYLEKFYNDAVENENTFAYNFTSTHTAILVPKGTYANLAAAQAGLAGTIIQYELLAEVITENIDVDGIAFAYKNMTIEIIQDNGFSNSWFVKHDLNDAATIQALGKALQTAEKQITKLEDETAANKAANESTQTDLDLAELDIIDLQNDKVDKIVGKGLSENDYTDADKAAVTNNLLVEYDKMPVNANRLLSENNIVAQTGSGYSAVYSSDGLKLYVAASGLGNDIIYQYACSEPFGEISSFINSNDLGTTLGLRGIILKEDGTKIIVCYITSTNIESYIMSTPYDITTLGSKVTKSVAVVAPGGVRDIAISLDGLDFYYLEDGADDTITYATFSSAWDLASLSDVNNFDGSSINIVLNGIAITETGGKMLVIGSNDNKLFEILMPTAFSFSGASESDDSIAITGISLDGINIVYGSGVVLLADPGANSIARVMIGTASTKLTDALVSLTPE